jgi:hypothetical protein
MASMWLMAARRRLSQEHRDNVLRESRFDSCRRVKFKKRAQT